jgi:hypothetical protein
VILDIEVLPVGGYTKGNFTCRENDFTDGTLTTEAWYALVGVRSEDSSGAGGSSCAGWTLETR